MTLLYCIKSSYQKVMLDFMKCLQYDENDSCNTINDIETFMHFKKQPIMVKMYSTNILLDFIKNVYMTSI